MIAALVIALALPSQSPCQIRVDSVGQYGMAFSVALHNRSDQPMRLTALHVTFTDALGQYQERTYHYAVLVQPKQAMKLQTPIVTDVIPQWRTAAASASCHPLSDDDDGG